MSTRRDTTEAAGILRRRYVGDDKSKRAFVEAERVHADVAQMIHDLRMEAGLSQAELARRVGTSQSAISRLEDADYAGHSLSMLNRIAAALNRNVAVLMTARDAEPGSLRWAFQLLLRNLRRSRRLTIEELARRADIDEEELLALERSSAYRPTRGTLDRLDRFYRLPARSLALLAGVVPHVPPRVSKSALAYVASSDSATGLSSTEKELLDEFIEFLRNELPERPGQDLAKVR